MLWNSETDSLLTRESTAILFSSAEYNEIEKFYEFKQIYTARSKELSMKEDN